MCSDYGGVQDLFSCPAIAEEGEEEEGEDNDEEEEEDDGERGLSCGCLNNLPLFCS